MAARYKLALKKLTAVSHHYFLLPRLIAIACFSYSVQLQAQALPELADRTSQSLQGLANDTTDKSLELGDFNGDGVEDILVVRRDTSPVLLINEEGVLTNRTEDYLPGLAELDHSNYAEAFDANNDGLTDLVFARLDRTPRLLLNRGRDTNDNWIGFDEGANLQGATNSLVIESGDVTGDGFADLFVIQVELASNKLLVNDGNGQFSDDSSRLGELAALQRGHSALLADVESDGDIDIIYIESDLFLHIYHNDGAGNYSDDFRLTFQNTDKFAYIFGAADFNGDGIFDYRQYSNTDPVAEMSAGFIDGSGLPVYIERQDPPMQRGNRKHGTVHMRDIDGDGDTDYVLSSMLRNFGGLLNTFEGMRTEIVINAGFNSGEFVSFTGEDWGRQESMDMKIIDVNADGNMDLFVAHENRYGVYLNGAPSKLVELASLTAEPQQAGLATSFSAQLVSGAGVQYEWDFGDGTVITTDQLEITHVFNRPGRYLITLTATGDMGSDQITTMQRVHETLLDGLPMSSSSITVEANQADGDRLWVVNPDNHSVSVFEAGTGVKLAEIPVDGGPRSIARAGIGSMLVTSKHSAELTVISTTDLTVTAKLELQPGSMPHGVVADSAGVFAWVVLEATGELVKLRLADIEGQLPQIVSRLNLGANPRHLALSSNANLLYVSRFITPPVAGESTRRVAVSGGGEIMRVNAISMQPLGTAVLPYNNVEDADNQSRGIPNYLTAPAISPHGRAAVVGAKLDNIYRGTMRDGNSREHNVLVRAMAATINLNTFTETVANRIDFDNNSPPSAVAFGPTGNFLFVIHEASRLFEVIDFYRGETVFSTNTGFAPQGLALSADGRQLYIHSYLSREVSFFDLSQLIDGESDNAVVTRVVQTVNNEVLSPDVLLGKQIFHDSADAALSGQKYISCAVCHSEMGHDGRTWDFADVGEGLRNTIDLRGRGGMGHGNIHWTANFDEIHDFENDIREVFNGSGLLSDDDYDRASGILDEANPKAGLSNRLDALALFVNTLDEFPTSPYRAASGELTDTAKRGYQVFREANCATCHSGVEFTDSPSGAFHNIGTVDSDTGNRLGLPLPGNGLDTPTLRGLWLGAPYLHDGSAVSLEAAVRAHRLTPGNASVRQISNNQMDDLVDYLMQIDGTEIRATSSIDNDGDLIPDEIDTDDDNDNVPDSLDALPLDATESADNDSDGIGDNRDPDDDNDGISDQWEGQTTNSDTDNVPDRFDLDSDNDTIPDVIEAGGLDANQDGRIDTQGLIVDPPDTDSDGLPDYTDLQSGSALNDASEPFDISRSRYADLDINSDGVLDSADGAIDNDNDGADDRVIKQPALSVEVGSGCVFGRAQSPVDPTLLILLLLSLFARGQRLAGRRR